ncbi:hypothetical protein [Roseovarius sp. 2305UL8-3]|uniref:hypothetical protein n=1 Tax=Roseovarius conchicola TaxID=3121636 RepID=UPI00352762ED
MRAEYDQIIEGSIEACGFLKSHCGCAPITVIPPRALPERPLCPAKPSSGFYRNFGGVKVSFEPFAVVAVLRPAG